MKLIEKLKIPAAKIIKLNLNQLSKNYQLEKLIPALIISGFFLINLIILTKFPFIHSDEAWLSGLSRQIAATHSLKSTESFFDLMPRHPHAIKIFFHLIQISFSKIFGYHIFTFRLISLLSGTAALYFFYRIAQLITADNYLSNLAVLTLAVDIHFIYSSHLARQEIILVLIILIAFYYFLSKIAPGFKHKFVSYADHKVKNHFNQKHINLALILVTAIGFHPNALIIAMPFIFIYNWQLIFKNNLKRQEYLNFMLTIALGGAFFILISLSLDSNFFSNYSNYGNGLGVFAPFSVKISRLIDFYKKIFYRISGTYYIPPVKLQLIIFLLITITACYKLIKMKLSHFNNKNTKLIFYFLISLLAINFAYILIGRYNQTSIIFIFPFYYLLFFSLIKNLKFKIKTLLSGSLIIILCLTTFITLKADSSNNYQLYLKNISHSVPAQTKVLANLNSAYYFSRGSLFDYRNLAYLKQNKLSFADYINKNKIKYIIYPEEMDYIYQTRPTWNILYGNLYPYYEQLQLYLKENCHLIYQFSSPTYGNRIVSQIDQKNWSIKIYLVE
ncbi:ArnT family glycosyltransferase [Halanaerobium salsuginis]|uniref:Dolichyl-phosphate-mannose-protein mannosyltransferase n=1 Tax=Halanaerobium salsuginis TaxID=29563 RepID=A0A1I4H5W4_9FIRM|nr:glycosyltransferase family 39 protein [Halanaerobium salsuginis]SFL36806.1 Dolichyl-phosphate-mannose-protein mannosyltransferase [Halanaerobium salsuginis]